MRSKNTKSGTRRHNEAGISVMETLVVLMIVTVILAFALPAVRNSISAYNVRSAADHVAQRLTAARTLAMTKNKQVTISFNRTSGLYGFDFPQPGDPVVPPDGIPDTQDPDDPSTNYLVESPSGGTRILFPSESNIMVSFNSRGEMPIGAADQDIRVSNTSNSATVHINLRGKVWVTIP